MDLGTAHAQARAEAQRLPALSASLGLLLPGSTTARISLYGTTRPSPGASPGAAPLVTIVLDDPPAVLDTGLYQIQLTVPIEGVVGGAETDGTDALWARIFDGSGDWWADASVSEVGAGGEVQLESTLLRNGGLCRLVSAVLQG